MAQNTYGAVDGQNQLSNENAEFYSRTLLDRLKGELIITKYAQKGLGAPKNAGDQISYRRFGSLTTTTDALVEGTTPTALSASVAKVNSTVKQFGDYLIVTDKLQTVGLDPVITELSEVMGEAAGDKIERICINALVGGTNVVYGGSAAQRIELTSAMKLTAALLLKIATQLKLAKARPITLPDGSKGYLMFANPKQCYDLKQDTTWLDANKYVDNKNLINGLCGKLYGIYVVEYDFAPELVKAGAGAAGSEANVYQAIVISEGGFGMPDIEGSAAPKMLIKVPKEGDNNTDDPLSQRSTIGWKNLFDCVILDQLRVVRVETGSSY